MSFFRESDRALIVGDAFVTTKQESALAVLTQRPELHGPPMYFTPDWDRAWSSVKALAALEPLVALTGRRQIIGRLELRHSPSTHAAWGRFLGEPGLDVIALHRYKVDLTVGVTREADDRSQEYTTEYGFDHHFSGLLLTAGSTLFAWVTVRFDDAEVAHGKTDRWQETVN